MLPRSENLKPKTLNFKLNSPARVAELVYAADSKSADRKDVSVRLRSQAQKPDKNITRFLYLAIVGQIEI